MWMCSTTCSVRLEVKGWSSHEEREQTDLHKHTALTVSVFLKIKRKERERRRHKSPFSAQLVLSAGFLANSHLTVHNKQYFMSFYRLSQQATNDKYWTALYEGTVAGLSRAGESLQTGTNCSGMPIPKWWHQGRMEGEASVMRTSFFIQFKAIRNYVNGYFNECC